MNPGFRPLPDLDRCMPPAARKGVLQPARAWMVAAFVPPLAALFMAVAMQLPAPADSELANMSGLRVEGLAGYPVHDVSGVRIGEIRQVETDYQGRTRYINMQLNDGREARLSAFSAQLDPAEERVDLLMPLYAVERAATARPVVTAASEDVGRLAARAGSTLVVTQSEPTKVVNPSLIKGVEHD